MGEVTTTVFTCHFCGTKAELVNNTSETACPPQWMRSYLHLCKNEGKHQYDEYGIIDCCPDCLEDNYKRCL